MDFKVFIATSLDGYIADKDGGLDWLHAIPNPDSIDMGFHSFMDSVDALLMGRSTFEMVLSFGVEWPYSKPVYILSSTLESIPASLEGKAFLAGKSIEEALVTMKNKGIQQVYVDGGKTIQSALNEGLVTEMVITTIPVLLGGGVPLFGPLPVHQQFTCIRSEIFLNSIVQNTYQRKT